MLKRSVLAKCFWFIFIVTVTLGFFPLGKAEAATNYAIQPNTLTQIYQVRVYSSGENFSWTSPFPIDNSALCLVDVRVVDMDLTIKGGILGGVISWILPLYYQQLLASVNQSLGIQSHLVGSLPATVASGSIEVTYEGQRPFGANVLFTIDEEGYGHIDFTEIRLGSIDVNIPPFGDVTIYLDSFTADLVVTFVPIIDCNGNGQPDALDIEQGLSFDRNMNGVPDECDPDQDHDSIPDDIDNCPNTFNPDQRDRDSDGVGDECETDWQVHVHSSGENFSWTSPFPLDGFGPWMIDVRVVDVDLGIKPGIIGNLISRILPAYYQQLLASVNQALGIQSHLVGSLPATVASGSIEVTYEGQSPFGADVLFTIDEEGYGHVDLTKIRLSRIDVNIPPFGNVTIYLDSFTADFLIQSTYVLNHRPVAEAGQDQTGHFTGAITLNGSNSWDPDANYPLSYFWRFVAIPPASATTLSAPSSDAPTFFVDSAGDYIIELVVADSLGKMSIPDIITVSCLNIAPIADAGEDQLLSHLHIPVFLDGSKSYDGDQDAIKYSWSILLQPDNSSIILSDPLLISPSFVPNIYGSYKFGLVVTDTLATSSNLDTVTVTINNIRPVARAVSSPVATVGEIVTLDGSSSSDANSDPLTFNWTLITLPAASKTSIQDPMCEIATFVPDIPGTYIARLVVNDGYQPSEPATVRVEAISGANHLLELLRLLIERINNLPDSSFKNKNLRKSLVNKINAVVGMVNAELWDGALAKMQHDICSKTDGCSNGGSHDSNDWLVECTAQAEIYGLIMVIIDILGSL